ncbi:hypothetical protein GCM10011512_21630 [Tersicoccus solisilvae]|uniref:Photosystem reaction center subunit H n=1 Tax=Tersicoccus solisilvae TaxID=1882339 RepID=A0ABQ1PC36_9MICC|nr:PRC and DUF2382 domain-containing protein [Tersicoccus solisilvae]GGC94288.1 hypothetical protein GCM10011512_21630 [Tersicoccus solisilvae]
MSTNLSIEQLQSATVIDQDGDKIGDVGQVYVDDATGDPSWVTVRTGLFGTKETFIPLDRAQSDANGVRVPYEKKFVKDAPNMNEDEHLSPEQEAELYRYYGLDAGTGSDAGRDTGRSGTAGVGTGTAAGTASDRTGTEGEYTDIDRDGTRAGLTDTGDTTGTAGYASPGTGRLDDGRTTGTSGVDADAVGTSGYTADLRDPDTATTGTATTAGTAGLAETDRAGHDDLGDESIVRREERLRVGTETRETGRLRLRKHVVTENQTVTVPVEREEVTIEREPIADGESHTGGTIGTDEEQTITLTEEVPVVEKEVVDAERINVHRDTVQDEQSVSGEIRKEEIDVDQDGTTGLTDADRTGTRRPDTDRY